MKGSVMLLEAWEGEEDVKTNYICDIIWVVKIAGSRGMREEGGWGMCGRGFQSGERMVVYGKQWRGNVVLVRK